MIMFSEYMLYYGLYILECLSVGTKALSLWVRQIFASSSLTILAYEWVKERQSGQSEETIKTTIDLLKKTWATVGMMTDYDNLWLESITDSRILFLQK